MTATTSFAHVDYPTQHPGVVRAERVAGSVRNLINNFDATRATASMLLAALVAALMVVANQVVDTWTEGHLLAAWIVLWTVAFAALGLLAKPARRGAVCMRCVFKDWAARRRQAAEDQEMWNVALADARVMADISRAMNAAGVRPVKTL
jgi:hypothetical protein